MTVAVAVDETETLRRLRWQCRRGLRELDELLGGFLETGYGELDMAGRRVFARLLAEPDAVLNDWLFGRASPMDGEYVHVIARIRNTPGA